MTVLRYTVPPENDGCRLGLFLRMQGVTAGLIKSVKYDGDGFFADDRAIRTNEPVHTGQCIRFALPPERETSVVPQPVPFSVAYEDAFAAVRDAAEESDLSLLGSTVDHLPRSASFMKCHHAGRDRRADAVLERAYQRERQPISARVPKGARHLVVGLVGQPPLSGPLAVVIEIQWFMRHSGFPRSRLGQGR